MLDERQETEERVNDDNPLQTTETTTTTPMRPGDSGGVDVVVVHWLLLIKMRSYVEF